jgi:hypothetical protein
VKSWSVRPILRDSPFIKKVLVVGLLECLGSFVMRTARFLKPDPEGCENPGIAIYHLVSRIVDRNFVLGTEEKEHFIGQRNQIPWKR